MSCWNCVCIPSMKSHLIPNNVQTIRLFVAHLEVWRDVHSCLEKISVLPKHTLVTSFLCLITCTFYMLYWFLTLCTSSLVTRCSIVMPFIVLFLMLSNILDLSMVTSCRSCVAIFIWVSCGGFLNVLGLLHGYGLYCNTVHQQCLLVGLLSPSCVLYTFPWLATSLGLTLSFALHFTPVNSWSVSVVAPVLFITIQLWNTLLHIIGVYSLFILYLPWCKLYHIWKVYHLSFNSIVMLCWSEILLVPRWTYC